MDSFLGLDLLRNYSYFSVPAAFLLAALPHMYAVLSSRAHYDNANPRGHHDSVARSETLNTVKQQCMLRAKAATANGFETLGFYASAVVAANVTGVEVGTLNTLTLGYVLSRFVYNFAYIWLQKNRRLAGVRSLSWVFGIVLAWTLWIKAGNRALVN
ncbi:hypothetical protein B0J13DRAFT_536701 [Dactylonectria estremocensis]|uniref:Uncharacterized protein n=1 Tax=Dactylonectria estremocensis TaxID=1079267 RepID=A0A9P9JEK5_9HYPO|nr:hypothetical protein B0J13DRAFT_536701 [Dactylonectria estremocensis]